MSRTSHHHRRQIKFKPRSWFTNLMVVRPERQDTRNKIVNILKLQGRPTDEDVPLFAEGNKPDADWSWI